MAKINDISKDNARIYLENINNHNIKKDIKWFLEQARFPVFSKIIDVGSGSGKLIKKLGKEKRMSRHLIGVEPSVELYNYSSCNIKYIPNAKIINTTFEELNIGAIDNWNTDIIVMSFFLHHCNNLDNIFNKAAKTIRSGGKIYIFDRICINDEAKSDFKKYWDNCYQNLHEWKEETPNVLSINDISNYAEKYGFKIVSFKTAPHDTKVGCSLFPKSFIELWKVEDTFFNCLLIPPAFKKYQDEIISELIKNTSINKDEYDLIKIPYSEEVLKLIYPNLPWGEEFRKFALKKSPSDYYSVIIPKEENSIQILAELNQFKNIFREKWKKIEGEKDHKSNYTPMILPFHIPEPWEVFELNDIIKKYNVSI